MKRLINMHNAKTSLAEKLNHALKEAERNHDGHLTIMFFTTHVKVIPGTPDLSDEGREQVWRHPGYKTLEDALDQKNPERIPYGFESPDHIVWGCDPSVDKCGDCGVGFGQIHKKSCDLEQCPACGGQRLSCGC